MKYYTFNLDWTNPDEGTDPSTVINVDSVRFEPSFQVGEAPNATYYAYLISGDIDVNELTQWNVAETTLEDTFIAAQSINPDAFLVDGKVYYPSNNIF